MVCCVCAPSLQGRGGGCSSRLTRCTSREDSSREPSALPSELAAPRRTAGLWVLSAVNGGADSAAGTLAYFSRQEEPVSKTTKGGLMKSSRTGNSGTDRGSHNMVARPKKLLATYTLAGTLMRSSARWIHCDDAVVAWCAAEDCTQVQNHCGFRQHDMYVAEQAVSGGGLGVRGSARFLHNKARNCREKPAASFLLSFPAAPAPKKAK